MGREDWQATVHAVKERVTYDSVTAYKKDTGDPFILSAPYICDFMHALHIAWVLNLQN